MVEPAAYTVTHIYKSYVEHTKDNPSLKIDYATFRAIVVDYSNWVMDEVLERSREVKLPGRAGSLLVIKRKPFRINRRNFNVDFKHTNELGKTVLHLNEHSDGFRYRFRWKKSKSILKNKTLYEMVMSRANKRRLAYIIKNKLNDFIEE